MGPTLFETASDKQEELRKAREKRRGIFCYSVTPIQLYNRSTLREAPSVSTHSHTLITLESLVVIIKDLEPVCQQYPTLVYDTTV